MRHRYRFLEELVDIHNVKVEMVSEQSLGVNKGGNILCDARLYRVPMLA
jgi:hypothetical protein